MLQPRQSPKVDYEVGKITDEITGILKLLKDPKDAVFRLLFQSASHFKRMEEVNGESRLAQHLGELCDAVLSDLGGEELLSSPWEWESQLPLDRHLLGQVLQSYGRILLRYGMSGSKSTLWINYILQQLGVP